MDSFRLNPDAVRRAMPGNPVEDADRDDNDRLAERVREVEARVDPERADSQDGE